MQGYRLQERGCRFRWRIQGGEQGFPVAIVKNCALVVRDGAAGAVVCGGRVVVIEHDGLPQEARS